MPATEATKPRKLWRSVAAVVLVIVTIISISVLYLGARGKSDLEKQIDLARREGIATSYAELAPNPPVKDSENAAPFCARAVDELQPYETEFRALMDRHRELDLNNLVDRAKFRNLYAELKPAIDDLVQGAKQPRCDFHYTYGPGGPKGVISFDEDLRHLTEMIAAESKLLEMSGHLIEGIRLVSSVAPLCNHILDYRLLFPIGLFWPAIISYPVSNFIREALIVHGRQPGVPEAASAALSALGPDPDVAKSLIGDEVSHVASLRPTSIQGFLAVYRLKMGPEFEEVEADSLIPGVLDSWKAVEIDATRKMVAKAKEDSDDLSQLVSDIKAIEATYASRSGREYLYAKFSARTLSRSIFPDNIAPEISRRRILTQAAAIFASWNRNGKLPASLPLTGIAAHDPIAERPYNYIHTANGFSIAGAYSAHALSALVSKSELTFTYPATAK